MLNNTQARVLRKKNVSVNTVLPDLSSTKSSLFMKGPSNSLVDSDIKQNRTPDYRDLNTKKKFSFPYISYYFHIPKVLDYFFIFWKK